MSKRTRNTLILIALTILLIAAVLIVNYAVPSTTDGLQDVINR